MSLKFDHKKAKLRAEEGLTTGLMTQEYLADRTEVVEMLNRALATELVCALRYRSHYYRAQRGVLEKVAREFLEHATQEEEHAHRIADRIDQLGGVPDYRPDTLIQRSLADFESADDLTELIKINLIHEKVAVEFYTAAIRWVGTKDPVTRRLLEDILEQEEEHADDLSSLLEPVEGANRLRRDDAIERREAQPH